MADLPTTPAPRPPRARRRLGRWLLVLLVLLWIGRGLGLAGREPQPTGGAGKPADLAADVTGAAEARDAAAPPVPAAAAAETAPAAPLVEPAPSGTGVAVGAAGPAAPAFDADRFASLLSALAVHTTEGQLGSALATLQHMRGLPLDGAQRAALVAASAPLETALAAACGRIVEHLCHGRALLARDELERLCTGGEVFVEPWLDLAWRAVGLPEGVLHAIPASEAIPPLARPLARGREVRVLARDRTGSGTVVDSRSDQVTVRMQTPTGWSFPTVSALCCEPVQPTADEAIELGFAALQARADRLARLWLAVARLRSPQGLGERGQRLAAFVR